MRFVWKRGGYVTDDGRKATVVALDGYDIIVSVPPKKDAK